MDSFEDGDMTLCEREEEDVVVVVVDGGGDDDNDNGDTFFSFSRLTSVDCEELERGANVERRRDCEVDC
jgi:hypothetical protein